MDSAFNENTVAAAFSDSLPRPDPLLSMIESSSVLGGKIGVGLSFDSLAVTTSTFQNNRVGIDLALADPALFPDGAAILAAYHDNFQSVPIPGAPVTSSQSGVRVWMLDGSSTLPTGSYGSRVHVNGCNFTGFTRDLIAAQFGYEVDLLGLPVPCGPVTAGGMDAQENYWDCPTGSVCSPDPSATCSRRTGAVMAWPWSPMPILW